MDLTKVEYPTATYYKFDQNKEVVDCYKEVEDLLEKDQYISHAQHDFQLDKITFDIVVKRR